MTINSIIIYSIKFYYELILLILCAQPTMRKYKRNCRKINHTKIVESSMIYPYLELKEKVHYFRNLKKKKKIEKFVRSRSKLLKLTSPRRFNLYFS